MVASMPLKMWFLNLQFFYKYTKLIGIGNDFCKFD